MAVTLRPAGPDDRELFLAVYASTREEELAQATWAEGQKEAFLRQQFEAQDRFYRENYPGALFQVILRDGAPAGRLYVHHRANEIRLMDIALLPEHRNAGIGTALLGDLFAEATAARKSLTIHVEKFNPALRLYERLGFRQIADKGVYVLMEWKPEGSS
ncbi:MAG TPA: GNAT family N-acetyltransferase [Thermoanaerobaculia bacterium]|nr:GNAT family N-acetyltransferase [Thermoanaerobaculia bacterium]